MLDLSRPESKEILLKKGFPEQLIEKLDERQNRGEKIPTYVRFTDADGKKRFEKIPDSPEEIEERNRIHEEMNRRKTERSKKIASDCGYSLTEYRRLRNNKRDVS